MTISRVYFFFAVIQRNDNDNGFCLLTIVSKGNMFSFIVLYVMEKKIRNWVILSKRLLI